MRDHLFDGPLRRETWIHPDGGRRVRHTAPIRQLSVKGLSTDEEELHQIDSIEVGHSKLYNM